jgi:ribosomal protein S18 acetylase RimI-like enzyme
MSDHLNDHLSYRLATPKDIPALHALIESGYRGESAKAGWTHEADLLGGQRTDVAELSDLLAQTGSVIVLRVAGERLLGCVALKRHNAAGVDYAYLGMLTIAPTHQGQKHGDGLLAHALDYVKREWASPKVQIYVIAQRTELIAWYARRGFVDTCQTAPFPYGDPRFGAPKRDDLYFKIFEKLL